MRRLEAAGITKARLKELLDYDPVTGIFRWRSGNSRRVGAGDEAGGKDAWGYVKIYVDGRAWPAHRLAWFYVYGEDPLVPVKHGNGVGSDNRIANLYVLDETNRAPKTLTAARLREVLDYDPLSGQLVWKITTSSKSPKGAVAGVIAKTGYRLISIDRNRHLAHRLVWMWHHGSMPSDDLDHVNGDPSDNRLENLRIATRSQNMTNTGLRRDNTSGYKGVSWHGQNRKWRAHIHKDGKLIHLGLFNTPEEAHAAYCEAAKELHGEFSRTQ